MRKLAALRVQSARAQANAQLIERRMAAPVQKIVAELVIYGLVPIALLLGAHLLIILIWDQASDYTSYRFHFASDAVRFCPDLA